MSVEDENLNYHLNLISFEELFSNRASAHPQRKSKRHLVSAMLCVQTFDKYDVIINTTFDHAESMVFIC